MRGTTTTGTGELRTMRAELAPSSSRATALCTLEPTTSTSASSQDGESRRADVITGWRAHIDLKKVCRHVDVVATIVLRSHGIEDFAGFEEVVGGMPYIVECTKVSGSIDYIVRFACPDLDSYHMLSDQLLKLGPRIAQLSSHVVLSAVKPYQGIALDGLL